jgi:hypothetical protein
VLNEWWSHLDEELADFQFVLHDEDSDTVLAEGQTGPFWWDGTDTTLPAGIDRALEELRSRGGSRTPGWFIPT